MNVAIASQAAPNRSVQYAFPATVGQEAFWFLDRLTPGDPAYNIALRFRLSGPLETGALERTLAALMVRHEALRTILAASGGELRQHVLEPTPTPLPVENVESWDEARRDDAMAAEARRGFDLEAGPLFRARLLRCGKAEHLLLVTMHHIVADGWSTGVLFRELGELYEAFAAGREPTLPTPTLQFGDYAVWHREFLKSPDVAAQLDYWKRQLADLEPGRAPHDLASEGAPGGCIESLLLPRNLTSALTDLARREGTTLFAVCLTGLQILLRQQTGRDDVAVGTLVAGRTRTELEPIVGPFVNTLVLRTDLAGDPPFIELLGRVRGTVADAMANQDVPFGRVVEAVPVRRASGLGRQPLFGVNFLFQKAFLPPRTAAGVAMTPIPSLSPGAMLDLNVFMVERDEGWRVSCEYNPNEYSKSLINRLLSAFQFVMEEAASNPSVRISRLAAKPLTAATPIDAAARSRAAPATESASTDSSTARDLGALWSELLGVANVERDANFFDLGGHSLKAARLLSMIQSRFGVRLPLASAFADPTLDKMAWAVEKALDQGPNHAPSSNGVSRNKVADLSVEGNVQEPPAADVAPKGAAIHAVDDRRRWSWRRRLATSDRFVGRAARRGVRLWRRASIPAPRIVVRPALYAFLTIRSVYYFLLRVFFCEPLFKAYCERYGRNVHTGTYIHWIKGNGAIVLGNDVTVDGQCVMTFASRYSDRPTLTVGDKTGISHGCTFVVARAITIGKECRIAGGVQMFDSNGHPTEVAARTRGDAPRAEDVRPITIGDRVWVGRSAIIGPGVTIGEGSVVAAGAVVMIDVPPFSIVGGNPAGVMGTTRPNVLSTADPT